MQTTSSGTRCWALKILRVQEIFPVETAATTSIRIKWQGSSLTIAKMTRTLRRKRGRSNQVDRMEFAENAMESAIHTDSLFGVMWMPRLPMINQVMDSSSPTQMFSSTFSKWSKESTFTFILASKCQMLPHWCRFWIWSISSKLRIERMNFWSLKYWHLSRWLQPGNTYKLLKNSEEFKLICCQKFSTEELRAGQLDNNSKVLGLTYKIWRFSWKSSALTAWISTRCLVRKLNHITEFLS